MLGHFTGQDLAPMRQSKRKAELWYITFIRRSLAVSQLSHETICRDGDTQGKYKGSRLISVNKYE
jgi:hypothetical protein